jgi:outer membrane protein OmpA-like peptidoglycan-associated protein
LFVAMMLVAAAAGPAPAQAKDDHPLVSRYPSSELASREDKDFERYRLIVGLADEGFTSRDVEGRLTRLRYTSPAGRSVGEIFANYEQALKAAGFHELWRCADKECGPAFAAARWGRFNGTINLGSDSRYLAGSLKTATGEAYVAVAVAPRQQQLTIVEVKAMEAGLVKVDPDALGDELDRLGHVAIPGVFFETGKSELTPDSDAALEAMAQILKERPGLDVWVVGHTDWTGDFDLNLRLSDARAKAVAAALARRYGVEAGRLQGLGIGPLAPAQSNADGSGRAANRRVELVARPSL